jgi:hypothetical protein
LLQEHVPPFRAVRVVGPRWCIGLDGVQEGAQGVEDGRRALSNSSAKYLVSKDVPVQNIQSARTFQYKIFSKQGNSRTKCSVSRNIPVQNIQSGDIPVKNIQSVGTFQYKIFSQ